jgi:hypothetical protein
MYPIANLVTQNFSFWYVLFECSTTPEVLTAFIVEAEAALDELSTIVNIMPAPPMSILSAKQHAKLIVLYADEIEAGERVVAPFRALATQRIGRPCRCAAKISSILKRATTIRQQWHTPCSWTGSTTG